MWLNFDPDLADRELGWAKSIGFNSVRLWLSVEAYQLDLKRFLSSLENCLDLCRKHGLTAMLVLFDSCGIEKRAGAVPMTVNDAYKQFLSSTRLSEGQRKLIRQRYGEFAEGRGKDMWIKVGEDTPFDVLFWQNWSPNPGVSHLGRSLWSQLEKYVDDVVTLGERHSQVIAYDLMNEPGCLFDIPAGSTQQAAMADVATFLDHMGQYLEQKRPKAARTIGSSSLDELKKWATYQTLLSIHSYRLDGALTKALEDALAFARLQNKPIVVSECLANTNDWLTIHGEERLSTDEAQLRHYETTVPILLGGGMGWYSWGFVAGGMFSPFTDIILPNGYRRPAAVYLEERLKGGGLAERIVVLTFDDAVKSHRTFVAPLLKELGFGATFFVTHRWMDDSVNFMTWREIAEIDQMGFEIGNHSWTHDDFSKPASADRLPAELAQVEAELAKVKVPSPISFAYCGDNFGPEAVAHLKTAGYRFARRGMQPEVPYGEVKVGPVYDPQKNHPLLIPTTGDAYPGWTLQHFQRVVNQAGRGRIPVLQFHGVPDPTHPWVNTQPEFFRECMAYLKQNNFRVIALRDIEKYYGGLVAPDDLLLRVRFP
jgi:peptidoglycan/xylan/chitin deacetylase (PgdA/CDA1 family)